MARRAGIGVGVGVGVGVVLVVVGVGGEEGAQRNESELRSFALCVF